MITIQLSAGEAGEKSIKSSTVSKNPSGNFKRNAAAPFLLTQRDALRFIAKTFLRGSLH